MNSHRNVCIYFILLIPVTLLAFWKSYFGLLGNMPGTITPLIHVHTLIMMLWLFMLVAQAWFVHTKRYIAHRWVGRSSFVIAPLVILSSLATLQRFFKNIPEGEDLAQIYRLHVLAFGMVVAFTITWGLAMIYRKQAAIHIRYIVSTVFAVSTAIVFRIFDFWIPGGDDNDTAVVGNFCVIILSLLLLIALDWRMGVKRSAYWVVAIVQGIAHLGYWTYAKSGAFLSFCQWFADLGKI